MVKLLLAKNGPNYVVNFLWGTSLKYYVGPPIIELIKL